MYSELDSIIRSAISEDIGDGDHTSLSTITADKSGKAQLIVKEQGILAGMTVAQRIFELIDSRLEMEALLKDGMSVSPGDIAFYVDGPVIKILQAERLVLNFMQRMSGIATLTRKYVDAVAGTKARILDTRKTTPNFRFIEKLAVLLGGGENHRFGLFDMILIKDNHVDFAGGIEPAISRVKTYLKNINRSLKIEIEVRTIEEVREVLSIGEIDRIMLDNFTVKNMGIAVDLINGRYETEASGGINLQTVREVALSGVDFISVGALTHQIHSLDLSLKAV